MTRLPESRRGNRKYGEKTKSNDKLTNIITDTNEIERPSKLQPLTPKQSTRLPPLKSQRLPGIKTAQSPDIPEILTSKPKFDPHQTNHARPVVCQIAEKPKHSISVKTHNLPSKETVNDRNKAAAIDRHNLYDIPSGKPKDGLVNKKCPAKLKENIYLEEIKPHPPGALKDPRTKLKPTCPQTGSETAVSWQKERELLRKHRKQQAERMKASAKPMKATIAFDKSGKESKLQNPISEKINRNPVASERQKIDLSVRRKREDDEEWDWDKDIEEYLKIEEIEVTRQPLTSGTNSPVPNGEFRQQMPVISNCSKKGVGFKSKRRIEEEKQQELVRVEKEQREKANIELMIPQKIRKDLKKYGFR